MRASLEKRSEDAARLREYFAGLPDGEEVLWIRIEADTGIAMTMANRELARRALRRLKRPYETLRGDGVRLSAPSNTMTIARHRFVRIDNAVRRADRTCAQLSDRHFKDLPPDQQKKMSLMAGLFGAIRVMASGKAKEILS